MIRTIKTGAALVLFFMAMPVWAAAAQKSFAFVNANYVITAEVAGEHSFVLNFINLSDFVIVVQPNEFIYRGVSGRYYIGQVYQKEMTDSKGEKQRFTASVLLRGHSFAGLTVVGAFHEQEEIEELSVRIGAKRFYLHPLEKQAFEQVAKRIGDLDLKNADSAEALKDADLSEIGRVRNTDGTSEWDRDWQGLLLPDGSNPPKIIEKPDIPLTNEARKSKTYGKVKLSAVITRNGAIQDLKVVKGLGKGLDQRAIDGVQNSWVFLPATRNGEVFDSAIGFDVEFLPEKR